MANQLDDLCGKVATYLDAEYDPDAEDDGEELMGALDAAVAAHPSEARLYGLRARMHAMSYDVVSAARDFEQAVAFAPDDRESALALAATWQRRGRQIAEGVVMDEKHADDDKEVDDDAEEDDWDEADEARASDLAGHYERNSVQILYRLMQSHSGDLAFVRSILDAVDDMYALSPWTHYTLLLTALAAHPHDVDLLAREARFLVSLASYCAIDSEAIPMGYFESVNIVRYHAKTLEMALHAIDAVTREGSYPDLMASKGELLAALEEYPAAVAAYEQAAALFDAAAAQASDDERDALAESADNARAQASLCRQGREALIQNYFGQIDAAMSQLTELQGRMGTGSSVDTAELNASMAGARAELESVGKGTSKEQQEALQATAASIAKKTVGLISFDPVVIRPIALAALEGGLAPWFDELQAPLTEAGLSAPTQFDNPANNKALGMQCQGQMWANADGSSVLVAETVKSLRLKRLVTELSDHSYLMTVDARTTSFWSSGPLVDSLSVDKDTPIGEMVHLHLARVARRVAETPGLRAVPITSLERLAEVENRIRESKIDFRYDQMITEVEVRGMHVKFHAEFMALLKREIGALLAAKPRPSQAV
jgi:hypothetical protein